MLNAAAKEATARLWLGSTFFLEEDSTFSRPRVKLPSRRRRAFA